MKYLIAFLVITLVVASCGTNNKPVADFLTPNSLKIQFFSIDPSKDTIIRTSQASILKIKKGSYPAADGPVSIQIKEAFTPEEIFAAGLITSSNGRLLRSAGMIYFMATSMGKELTPQFPITAAIASKKVDPEMQVFKGELAEDSLINWVNPINVPIDTIGRQEMIANGKAIFTAKCKNCHSITTDLTGPALRGLQSRGPWANLKNIQTFLNNPPMFMSLNHYTQLLKAEYGSMMTMFPDITLQDTKNLIAYINSVSSSNDTIVNDESKYVPVICGYDTIFVSNPVSYSEYDMLTETPLVIPETNSSDIYDQDSSDPLREKYEFNITTNGWYNVDAFIKTDPKEIREVELLVEVKTVEDLFMNVYVFVPTERVLQSTQNKKGNKYFFDMGNGKITLPLRTRAIIFSYASTKDKIFYGVSEFTIKDSQIIPVELKETTREGLQYILQSKNINGVQLAAIEKKQEIIAKPCNASDNLPR